MTPLPDLADDVQALRVVKRPIPVQVRFADTDGVCNTLEGPVNYSRGDAILTGVAGETWPVGRTRFDDRYSPAKGTSAGDAGAYVKRPYPVLARRIDAPLDLVLPQRGVLHGAPGDWLLQYDLGDYGIVRDDIFRTTYEVMKLGKGSRR
jgi:hypothetical protein